MYQLAKKKTSHPTCPISGQRLNGVSPTHSNIETEQWRQRRGRRPSPPCLQRWADGRPRLFADDLPPQPACSLQPSALLSAACSCPRCAPPPCTA